MEIASLYGYSVSIIKRKKSTSFLSGLAETLKSPEATAQLVETLVETDAETGQTLLRIPVPDKQTVQNILNVVGKLFG